jgi:peptidoglycan/LPS O-acetylase OafA/YrhL
VFFVRRAFRLFPVYLVCLAVSAFLTLDLSITTLQDMPWDTSRTLDRLRYLQNSRDSFWIHLALHIPLLHGIVPERFLPDTSYAFMGQAWSLSLEWQFYLLAPFVFSFMSWFDLKPLRQTALLVVLALLGRRLAQPSMLTSNLYLFAIGYFGFQLYRRCKLGHLSKTLMFGTMTLWTLVAALVDAKWLSVLIWAVVLLGIVETPALPLISRLRDFLCSRLSTGLGAISYSLYCCHMIGIFSCAYVLIDVMHVSDRQTYAIALIASSLSVSMLLAIALHVLIEKPSIALGRRVAGAIGSKSPAAAVRA